MIRCYMKIKIPKQFYHWCEQNHIKLIRKKRKNKYYFKGFGRYFRITADNYFQVSEPVETFDRWANSVVFAFEMPQTQHEFRRCLDKVFRSDCNDSNY